MTIIMLSCKRFERTDKIFYMKEAVIMFMTYETKIKMIVRYLINENGAWSDEEKTLVRTCAKVVVKAIYHRVRSEYKCYSYMEGCSCSEICGICDLAYNFGMPYDKTEYIRYKSCALIERILEEKTLHRLHQEYYKEHLCKL